MKLKSLGFIGGGRISKIFLQAYRNKQIEFKSVHVFDINTDIVSSLKQLFPEIEISDSAGQAAKQGIVFIALHPPAIMETLEKIKVDISPDSVIISLAPKISMEKIAGKLQSDNIVRMIPNATSVINEGYNPLCFSENFKADKEQIINILKPLGSTFEVLESKLEAYAIVSAMLPTYFWFQWKKLASLGEQLGLTARDANEAVLQSMYGALETYFNSQMTPGEVMDLIPVKPLGQHEEEIQNMYELRLTELYNKIRT